MKLKREKKGRKNKLTPKRASLLVSIIFNTKKKSLKQHMGCIVKRSKMTFCSFLCKFISKLIKTAWLKTLLLEVKALVDQVVFVCVCVCVCACMRLQVGYLYDRLLIDYLILCNRRKGYHSVCARATENERDGVCMCSFHNG